MANSRKSKSDALLERVDRTLFPILSAGSSILLGLSGGVDSVVLLHLLYRLAPRHEWRLRALHVHHGINPRADEWAEFCADLCARHEIPFQVERVNIAPLRNLGIEAAARQLRHAALAQQNTDFVALAHHLDDQAETLLLQLLRGAGVRGASAMPLIRRRVGAPAQLRPLLDVTRRELLDYAQQHALQWVEDESNADNAYPRNFLRHRVLPQLAQQFPAYRETLARSARHFAEASELLDQLAEQDAQGALQGGRLDIVCLQSLSQPRAKNLLRYFLCGMGAPMPHAVQLDEMLQQLCSARQDAAVCLSLDNWQIRRYQGKAYVLSNLPEPYREFHAQWNGEAALELPELGGKLYFEPCIGQGLSLKKLRQDIVTVRMRRGAERIRLDPKRPVRTLKNLLQEQGIPPWQRDMLPLLFCGASLVAIPGVGVACAYQAAQDESAVALKWSV